PLAALLHVLFAWVTKVHRGRTALASFEDIVLVATITAVVSVVMVLVNFSGSLVIERYYVRTLSLLGGSAVALVLMLWGRAFYRIYRDRRLGLAGRDGQRAPVVVIGAGEGARQLLGSMHRDPRGTWQPLA